MQNKYLNKLLILPFLLASITLQAEMETSVQFDIPIANIGIEIGELTENNHYFTGSLHFGAASVNRIEFNWSKVVSENESHLLGLGIGSLSAIDDDKLGSFDVEESIIYGSINYRFYANGIRNTGIHSYVKLVFDDEGGIPFLGIGYNF